MAKQPICNLIILGSGPAGLTAAIYAARADLKPRVFAGPTPGGQLTETAIVENFPGFPDGILGSELMEKMRVQAEKFGAQIIDGAVDYVDLSKKPFLITIADQSYQAKSVIIATGATARWLGIESETRLRGKGISACATCDGPLFRNLNVVVIGGGDAAMTEAIFLTKFARSVTIIHRRDQFRASLIMLNRVKNNPKIRFITNCQVVEFKGQDQLESIILQNSKTQKKSEIKADGAFLAIGHIPNTDIFKKFLIVDQKNYLKATHPPRTEIDGIFVAGDAYDSHYRQAVTAAGSGCQAALEAERYLATLSCP